MRYRHSASLTDAKMIVRSRSPMGARERAPLPGVKGVAHLENRGIFVIFCAQQGAKRSRDKNAVPTPRHVVTRCSGGLSIAAIAVQHRAGNRWQWHGRKNNGSATRSEVGEAQRSL
jgi:hypothetical protein